MLRHHSLLAAWLFLLGLLAWASPPIPAGEAVPANQIDRLIEQMGSGTFAERERATKALDAIGVPALEALRKAAHSEDAEVKRRAVELVAKIEKQAESARILAGKRVHLVYENKAVPEAVADLQKKSGYNLYLHDPQGRLKERTITLDTGDTSFWHALQLFCAKANLTEATMQDIMMAPPPAGVPPGQPGALLPKRVAPLPPVAVAPAVPMAGPMAVPLMPGLSAPRILLKDGKAPQRPTDDRSAIRVRTTMTPPLPGPIPAGEAMLTLEATPEPRLQWQGLQSVRIERAVDDQDQNLTQITPQVPAGPGGAELPAVAPALVPGAIRPAIAPLIGGWGGFGPLVPIQLKRGAKASRSLKELKGVLTARILSEAQPLLTADNVMKAAGKTFKGDEGGSFKIIEVKSDEQKQTTIRFEFEQPPGTFAAMPPVPAMPAVPAPIGPALPAPPPPPAPPAPAPAAQAPGVKPQRVQLRLQVQGGPGVIAMGGGAVFMGPNMGLSIEDAKGNILPGQMGQQQFIAVQAAGGANVITARYTLICRPGKDQGEPSQLVYRGRKQVTVDIPFTLKNVPLP